MFETKVNTKIHFTHLADLPVMKLLKRKQACEPKKASEQCAAKCRAPGQSWERAREISEASSESSSGSVNSPSKQNPLQE
jgi:hypothetical protein